MQQKLDALAIHENKLQRAALEKSMKEEEQPKKSDSQEMPAQQQPDLPAANFDFSSSLASNTAA